MSSPRTLQYVDTGGGAFILLPLALKKSWIGAGDEEAYDGGDYGRTEQFGAGLGVLSVGPGQALILGNPEMTAFMPLPDGGVFVQRGETDEDATIIAAIDEALAKETWTPKELTFDVGNGKLVLFDSAFEYESSDEDKRLKVNLTPGKYSVDTCTLKNDTLDLELIRLKKK